MGLRTGSPFCKGKRVMKFLNQELKLKNGLLLKLCPYEHAHSFTIALFIKGGCWMETRSQKGITHLLEHLCFRRCAGMNQRDFYQRIEKIGGFLRGSTRRDHIVFELSVHPQYALEAAGILRDLFAPNQWTKTDIRLEKQVVLKEIENRVPLFSDQQICAFFDFSTDGLFLSGTKSKVEKVTKQKLEQWKETIFKPESSCVIVCGKWEEEEDKKIQELFSAIPCSASQACKKEMGQPRSFLNRTAGNDRIYLEDYQTAMIGLTFDLDRSKVTYAEAELLVNLLAAGLSAPMVMRFREELGILESIPAQCVFYSFGGKMSFEMEVNPNDIECLFEQLAQFFSKEKITMDDFQCAKTFFTKTQYRLLDRPDEYVYLLGERTFVTGEQFTSVESFIRQYENITYERICETAEEIFQGSNLVVTASTTHNMAEYVKQKIKQFRKNI